MLRSQASALTRKNFLLTWRLRRSTGCELIAPLAIMTLIGILDLNIKDGLPDPTPVPFSTFRSEGKPFECKVFDNEDGKFGYGARLRPALLFPYLIRPLLCPCLDLQAFQSPMRGAFLLSSHHRPPRTSSTSSHSPVGATVTRLQSSSRMACLAPARPLPAERRPAVMWSATPRQPATACLDSRLLRR